MVQAAEIEKSTKKEIEVQLFPFWKVLTQGCNKCENYRKHKPTSVPKQGLMGLTVAKEQQKFEMSKY